MFETANHILSKEGILTTFSIAKRISQKDIAKLRLKIKSNKIDKKKFQELLRLRVLDETRKALISRKIPGIILPDHNIPDNEKKIMMELTYFASIIAKKINEKKLNKFYSCYIINAIVNMLGLDEEAFDDFHKKFSKLKENNEHTDDGSSADII